MSPWRVFLALLLVGLVFFGVFNAIKVERMRKLATMEAYGLQDNEGRVGVFEFVSPRPGGSRSLRIEALLITQRNYYKYASLSKEKQLSRFVYLEIPGDWAQRLTPPYTGLLTLGPSGTVLESFFCEKPCTVRPLLPYQGYIEVYNAKKEALPSFGARLRLIAYKEVK
jgi:hypothetical protein